MIDFIICDDNKEFVIMLRQKILEIMKTYKDVKCNFHNFAGYGTAFEEVVKSKNTFKVYFLDIETKRGSGLDAARLIREKYEDWNSIIIIVTAHEELKYEALSNRLYLFDFINKLNNLDNILKTDLKNVMKKYNDQSDTITLEYNHEIFKIEKRDIIYIEKELSSKKCLIKTIYEDRYIQTSLNDINNLLDDDFMKVSRSLIVNLKKIKSYDSKENTLHFINDISTNLISREYKKELKEYVRNNS